MDMSEARRVLVDEAQQLLDGMEAALLTIEEQGANPELINEVFRAAHTIKGSAGLFGLTAIVEFTHAVESLLVQVRDGQRSLDGTLAALLLRCRDCLLAQIHAIDGDLPPVDPRPAERLGLLDALALYVEPAALPTAAAAVVGTEARDWRIHLQCDPYVLQQGVDPLALLDYLATLGEIRQVACDMSALPDWAAFDPECWYLRLDLEFRTTLDAARIEQAFEFVREGGKLVIEPCPAVLVPAGLESPKPAEGHYVKVDRNKLDGLIDCVAELVIASATGQVAARLGQLERLPDIMGAVEQLVGQIRDRALNLRMTPVGQIFQRYKRVVRDVAQQLDKDIDLVIHGAETELDKCLIDKLADPLLHIVRNAIDHGMEPVAERLAAGKPARGTLTLNAYHDSGNVVIEVSDDGRGLNRAKIRAKAVAQGLVAADAELAPMQLDALIFAPGFSTAETVTDLSGRGVGMDVVRRSIEALRGSVEIESQQGQGTTLRIRLPLTLAIIDGFQVMVGSTPLVVPLDAVEECLDVTGRLDGDIVDLRGEALPCLRVAPLFNLQPAAHARQSLVVVRDGRHRVGLLVDQLVGELQAVIKPLGRWLDGIPGIGGSTILGDGRVALLLDLPQMLAMARRQPPNPIG